MGAGKGFFTNYPKHVFLILGNEFCERFSFYGMKAILVLFLTRALNFSDDAGTAIYHGFNMACYFMPLFGAMLADGFLGKYKTIFIISIVYATGNIIMAVGAIPLDGENFTRVLPFIGLVLIAIGTGGIKPCVSAFGADQFDDDQVRQKQTFFSLFYMAINLGSLVSMVITPTIRSGVTCYDQECYALAFGVPAALMLVAVIVFIAGTKWYKMTPPGDNVIGKLFGCVGIAIKGRCGCGGGNETRKDHWLDYADSKYDKRFIEDVKAVMRVLFMFIPLPIFWALFDQQGSRWILQAALMDGNLGGFVLEPDLIHVLNPLLVVIMVPLMESLLFPCLDKCRIPNRPLQRLGVGMFLAGTAFIITAFLQIAIDKTLPSTIGENQVRFKILNSVPCDISGHANLLNDEKSVYDFNIPYDKRTDLEFANQVTVDAGKYTFMVEFANCTNKTTQLANNFTSVISMEQGGQNASYNIVPYMTKAGDWKLALAAQPLVKKTEKGKSRVQFFNAWDSAVVPITMDGYEAVVNASYLVTSLNVTLNHGTITARMDNKRSTELSSKAGATYTAVLHYSSTTLHEQSQTVTQFVDLAPNTVNILWQVPQYFVMSFGEVWFSVTGLSFAYSQAPASMKAVLQAAWLMTNAFGNLIVMIITAVGKLPNQMAEFFLFAGLMYATVIIFAIMSITYKYVDGSMGEEEEEEDEKDREKEGVDNVAMIGVGSDELPPKYEAVQEADRQIDSTYM